MLKPGDVVLDLFFIDDQGRPYDLKTLAQYRAYALYFYPMDFTRVCTAQACSFRDVYGEIREHGGAIFGVSLDNDEQHRSFRSRYGLPFPLVYDRDKTLSRKFGTLRLGGFLRNKRVTFIMDGQGTIRERVHDESNADVHANTFLDYLRKTPA